MKQLAVRRGTLALIRAQPAAFVLALLGGLLYLGSRLAPGWIEKLYFDRLTLGAPGEPGLSLGALLGLLLAIEAARTVVDYGGKMSETRLRSRAASHMRANVVRNMLRRPGALPLPAPVGDAVSRLDNDVLDFADFPTWLPYLLGEGLFTVAALLILFRIAPAVTLLALLPLLGVMLLNRVAFKRVLRYARAGRYASGEVAAFLGEILGAVQAIKVAGAAEGVVAHFRQLNEQRRRHNVRHTVFNALFHALSENMGQLAVALMVVLIGGALARGELTVGDFALFASYLFFAAHFPALVGSYLTELAQQRAVLDRLQELQAGAPPISLVQPAADGAPQLAAPSPAARRPGPQQAPLLRASGLSYRYAGGGGVVDLDLTLHEGSITVVSGEVGSGKSTLLRLLLGLLPRQSGHIAWRGREVADPAAFFIPPRAAYTPQTPRLFSDTLRHNILLGLQASEAELWAAVEMAVLAPDVARLEHGLDTIVGPRGVRLSGGQLQRAAAARMFVRRAQLLVMDDLSSALDVETEQQLWHNLTTPRPGQPPTTLLVVSHRPLALRYADQVITL